MPKRSRESYVQAVNELRNRVAKHSNNAKFHATDIHRAETFDWWLHSFLKSRQNDLDVASAVFFECLKWRQSFGVHSIGLLELKTALENNFVYFHGNDNDGNRLLWINFDKNDGNEKLNQRLLVFWLERHCVDTENQPISIFMNFNNATAQTMDLNFIKFVFHCVRYYFPACCHRIYAHEVPLRLCANWRVVKQYIDAVDSELSNCTIQTVGRTIATYIPLRYVPKYMGGHDDFKFTLSDLARSTGSPMVRARRFGKNLSNSLESFDSESVSDESPLNSLIEEVENRKSKAKPENKLVKQESTEKKRLVKFEADYSQNTTKTEDTSILSTSIDWQHRKFMAVAPKRSITIFYDLDDPNEGAVNLILQSMSAWFVYFTVGANSRRHLQITPNKGILNPNERINVIVKALIPIHNPAKYKIEILAARYRNPPAMASSSTGPDMYSEAPEDRVKFHYDCFARADRTTKYPDCYPINEEASEYDKKMSLLHKPSDVYSHKTSDSMYGQLIRQAMSSTPKYDVIDDSKMDITLPDQITLFGRGNALQNTKFWSYFIILDACLAYIVYFLYTVT
ncbi:unnamed protein product [Bursaphelenchus okinawaensis]|uniref:CRAL-TRIO domain-containing protein n=1 Tax=Bursaphelenchus okinawaensis TaxID=465554 RepID=A0A811KJU1_9BILA|nr:unnamed protein product [Bursaphelenchus okinawaensis]CAG9106245.1 unnamed protein product [Bursaphelenchus okinawaensis]